MTKLLVTTCHHHRSQVDSAYWSPKNLFCVQKVYSENKMLSCSMLKYYRLFKYRSQRMQCWWSLQSYHETPARKSSHKCKIQIFHDFFTNVLSFKNHKPFFSIILSVRKNDLVWTIRAVFIPIPTKVSYPSFSPFQAKLEPIWPISTMFWPLLTIF